MAQDDKWYFSKEELDNTPSRRSGIDNEKEMAYRHQAACLIQDMGQKLQVGQLAINTAIVYMHRFYMMHSFARFHRNSIAVAAIFLAAKVEEQPRKLEHLIKVAHMFINKDAPMPDVGSEAYNSRALEVISNENLLLQTLGFDVAIDHPHTYVVKCCQLVRASRELAQHSYFMATNSLHLTTMCLQHRPTVVACLCIFWTFKCCNYEIQRQSEGHDWFYYIDNKVTQEKLNQLAADLMLVVNKYPTKFRKFTKPTNYKCPRGLPFSPSPAAIEHQTPQRHPVAGPSRAVAGPSGNGLTPASAGASGHHVKRQTEYEKHRNRPQLPTAAGTPTTNLVATSNSHQLTPSANFASASGNAQLHPAARGLPASALSQVPGLQPQNGSSSISVSQAASLSSMSTSSSQLHQLQQLRHSNSLSGVSNAQSVLHPLHQSSKTPAVNANRNSLPAQLQSRHPLQQRIGVAYDQQRQQQQQQLQHSSQESVRWPHDRNKYNTEQPIVLQQQAYQQIKQAAADTAPYARSSSSTQASPVVTPRVDLKPEIRQERIAAREARQLESRHHARGDNREEMPRFSLTTRTDNRNDLARLRQMDLRQSNRDDSDSSFIFTNNDSSDFSLGDFLHFNEGGPPENIFDTQNPDESLMPVTHHRGLSPPMGLSGNPLPSLPPSEENSMTPPLQPQLDKHLHQKQHQLSCSKSASSLVSAVKSSHESSGRPETEEQEQRKQQQHMMMVLKQQAEQKQKELELQRLREEEMQKAQEALRQQEIRRELQRKQEQEKERLRQEQEQERQRQEKLRQQEMERKRMEEQARQRQRELEKQEQERKQQEYERTEREKQRLREIEKREKERQEELRRQEQRRLEKEQQRLMLQKQQQAAEQARMEAARIKEEQAREEAKRRELEEKKLAEEASRQYMSQAVVSPSKSIDPFHRGSGVKRRLKDVSAVGFVGAVKCSPASNVSSVGEGILSPGTKPFRPDDHILQQVAASSAVKDLTHQLNRAVKDEPSSDFYHISSPSAQTKPHRHASSASVPTSSQGNVPRSSSLFSGATEVAPAAVKHEPVHHLDRNVALDTTSKSKPLRQEQMGEFNPSLNAGSLLSSIPLQSPSTPHKKHKEHKRDHHKEKHKDKKKNKHKEKDKHKERESREHKSHKKDKKHKKNKDKDKEKDKERARTDVQSTNLNATASVVDKNISSLKITIKKTATPEVHSATPAASASTPFTPLPSVTSTPIVSSSDGLKLRINFQPRGSGEGMPPSASQEYSSTPSRKSSRHHHSSSRKRNRESSSSSRHASPELPPTKYQRLSHASGGGSHARPSAQQVGGASSVQGSASFSLNASQTTVLSCVLPTNTFSHPTSSSPCIASPIHDFGSFSRSGQVRTNKEHHTHACVNVLSKSKDDINNSKVNAKTFYISSVNNSPASSSVVGREKNTRCTSPVLMPYKVQGKTFENSTNEKDQRDEELLQQDCHSLNTLKTDGIDSTKSPATIFECSVRDRSSYREKILDGTHVIESVLDNQDKTIRKENIECSDNGQSSCGEENAQIMEIKKDARNQSKIELNVINNSDGGLNYSAEEIIQVLENKQETEDQSNVEENCMYNLDSGQNCSEVQIVHTLKTKSNSKCRSRTEITMLNCRDDQQDFSGEGEMSTLHHESCMKIDKDNINATNTKKDESENISVLKNKPLSYVVRRKDSRRNRSLNNTVSRTNLTNEKKNNREFSHTVSLRGKNTLPYDRSKIVDHRGQSCATDPSTAMTLNSLSKRLGHSPFKSILTRNHKIYERHYNERPVNTQGNGLRKEREHCDEGASTARPTNDVSLPPNTVLASSLDVAVLPNIQHQTSSGTCTSLVRHRVSDSAHMLLPQHHVSGGTRMPAAQHYISRSDRVPSNNDPKYGSAHRVPHIVGVFQTATSGCAPAARSALSGIPPVQIGLTPPAYLSSNYAQPALPIPNMFTQHPPPLMHTLSELHLGFMIPQHSMTFQPPQNQFPVTFAPHSSDLQFNIIPHRPPPISNPIIPSPYADFYRNVPPPSFVNTRVQTPQSLIQSTIASHTNSSLPPSSCSTIVPPPPPFPPSESPLPPLPPGSPPP